MSTLRRSPLKMFQEPAKRLMANDVFQAEFSHRLRRRQIASDGHMSQSLVRPLKMIMDKPPIEDMPQVALAKDNEMIQDLCASTSHPTLAVGIQIETARGNRPKLQAVRLQDRAELRGELGIPVANDVRRPELGRLLGKRHAHVPSHLSHPWTIRTGRHAGNMDSPCVEVDEEQNVIRYRPAQCPDGLREKVSGPKRFDVSCDELMPGAFASLRAGIKAVLLQNPPDRRPRDIVEMQFAEFTENPPVAPAGGPGHLDNQLPDLFGLPGTPTFAGLLAGSTLLPPPSKRPRMDDGDDFLDLRAESRAKFQELGSFRRSDFDPFGKLLAKDPVFSFEVLDRLDKFFLRGAGQKQQEGVQ